MPKRANFIERKFKSCFLRCILIRRSALFHGAGFVLNMHVVAPLAPPSLTFSSLHIQQDHITRKKPAGHLPGSDGSHAHP